MLVKLLTPAAHPAAEADLRRLAAEQVQILRASAGRGDPGQVALAEDAIRADPWAAFTFDGDGFATLSAGEHTWQAGRFELPSIAVEECALRVRASFCNAGIHATATAASRIRIRRAAIASTRASNGAVMVKCGAHLMPSSLADAPGKSSESQVSAAKVKCR